MSLRGVRKALIRTPHQLISKKSKGLDDSLIASWEHDIKTAISGIEFLITQEKKWAKGWMDLVDTLLNVIKDFQSFHQPFAIPHGEQQNEEDDLVAAEFDEVEQFSKVTSIEMRECQKLFRILYDSISARVEAADKSFESRAKEMTAYLNSASKLITKRNHKKVDYDMSHNALEKYMNSSKSEATPKDQAHLEKTKENLDINETIYEDLEAKTLLVIPHVLSTLSEFLNKLTIKLYYQQWEIYEIFSTNLERFVEIHGLIKENSSANYKEIVHSFLDSTAEAYYKLDTLELFNEYHELQKRDIVDKTKNQLRSFSGQAMGTTIGATSALLTKTFHPSQKLSLKSMTIENPVSTHSRDGMFVSAADPIAVILEELRAQYVMYSQTENSGDIEEAGDVSSPDRDIFKPSMHTEESWLKPLSLTAAADSSTSEIESKDDSSLGKSPNDDLKEPSTPVTVESNPKSPVSMMSFSSPFMKDPKLRGVDRANDTARYTDVPMESIHTTIYNTTIKPLITNSPISTKLGSKRMPLVRRHVSSSSSITATIFSPSNTAAGYAK